jgi:hypothetical protein
MYSVGNQPVFNIGLVARFPDGGFRVLSQSLQQNGRTIDYFVMNHGRFLSKFDPLSMGDYVQIPFCNSESVVK